MGFTTLIDLTNTNHARISSPNARKNKYKSKSTKAKPLRAAFSATTPPPKHTHVLEAPLIKVPKRFTFAKSENNEVTKTKEMSPVSKWHAKKVSLSRSPLSIEPPVVVLKAAVAEEAPKKTQRQTEAEAHWSVQLLRLKEAHSFEISLLQQELNSLKASMRASEKHFMDCHCEMERKKQAEIDELKLNMQEMEEVEHHQLCIHCHTHTNIHTIK